MRLGQEDAVTAFPPRYQISEIKTMKEIRDLFPGGEANDQNWCFVGTGGVHGSLLSLDDVERILAGEHEETDALDDGKYFITVMIVQPRQCNLRYGEIRVGLNEIAYLRRLVVTTLWSVEASQEESTN